MSEAKQVAFKLSKEKGLTYINGYDHPHIIAGQGTLGLEIVEQVPDIDAIVVPTGGGGLLAGVSVAVKTLYPHIKIIVSWQRCNTGVFNVLGVVSRGLRLKSAPVTPTPWPMGNRYSPVTKAHWLTVWRSPRLVTTLGKRHEVYWIKL